MKISLSYGSLALLSCTALFGNPCLPGSLQTFINLGPTGCQIQTVQFDNFSVLPGQTVATPIDPTQIQVSPGGSAGNPILLFSLNTTASAGEAFESFFRFSTSGSFMGASIDLTPPSVNGDGAVTAVLDLCPNGSFAGGSPGGCSTSPASVIVFATDRSSLLSNSAKFPGSTPFDALVDLTIDGGSSGSATLRSATVGFSSVPEPSAGLLVALGLSALAMWQARKKFPRSVSTAILRNFRLYYRFSG